MIAVLVLVAMSCTHWLEPDYDRLAMQRLQVIDSTYERVLDQMRSHSGHLNLGRLYVGPSSTLLECFASIDFRDESTTDQYSALKAIIVQAKGEPISKQIQGLVIAHPDLDEDALIDRVAIDQWTLTESQCPAIRRVSSEFRSLAITPPFPSAAPPLAGLHFPLIEIRSWGTGGGLRLDLLSTHPLFSWADASLGSLLDCAAHPRGAA